ATWPHEAGSIYTINRLGNRAPRGRRFIPRQNPFIPTVSATFRIMRMIVLLKRVGAWLKSRKVKLGLGIRVTVAAMGALAIALACGLKLPLWAVLTSIIVTQMSVGRSLKATRDYLVGTLGGAIYGGAGAVLIPHFGEAGLLFVLVLGVGA